MFWRSRSFKVIEFGGNWKPVYDFLLVPNNNLGPISHRYWDATTYWPKIANFAHPLLFGALARGDLLRIYGKALRFLKLESSRQRRWRFGDSSLHRFWLILAVGMRLQCGLVFAYRDVLKVNIKQCNIDLSTLCSDTQNSSAWRTLCHNRSSGTQKSSLEKGSTSQQLQRLAMWQSLPHLQLQKIGLHARLQTHR